MTKSRAVREFLKKVGDENERLEGIGEIRRFLDPELSERTFYRRHRKAMEPYILVREKHWLKKLPKYYSFKRLVLAYMLRRKII